MAIPKLITITPCKGVKLPQPDDAEIRPLDPEQADHFRTYLDTTAGKQRPHRNAALYHVAIRCGVREGKLLGLRWSDIDLKRGERRAFEKRRSGVQQTIDPFSVPAKIVRAAAAMQVTGLSMLDTYFSGAPLASAGAVKTWCPLAKSRRPSCICTARVVLLRFVISS